MQLYTRLRSFAVRRDRIGRALNGLAETRAVPRSSNPSHFSFQIGTYPSTLSHGRGDAGAALTVWHNARSAIRLGRPLSK